MVKVKTQHSRAYSRHVAEIVRPQERLQTDRTDPLGDCEKEVDPIPEETQISMRRPPHPNHTPTHQSSKLVSQSSKLVDIVSMPGSRKAPLKVFGLLSLGPRTEHITFCV